MSLRSDLVNATLRCPLTDKKYIPLNVLHNEITAERVKEKLPVTWARWLIPYWDCDLETKIHHTRRVIAILVLLSKYKEIDCLLADGLADEHLPLSKDKSKNNNGGCMRSQCGTQTFASFDTCEEREDLKDMFLKKQWMVLAPVLDFKPGIDRNIPLPPLSALPFKCKEIDSTQFSTVYDATLLPLHHPRENGLGSVRVAIKKFIKEKDFAHERDNLKKVQGIDNEHLIRHLAICDQAMCLFFPWADGGNLGKFWEHNNPEKLERNADLFRWSLRQLKGLAHAMAELYKVNFRHGDLKPSNILHFTEGDAKLGTLKIADLGVSRMHKKSALTDLRPGYTMTTASTRTYQAPEASEAYRKQAPRSRKYDSWSMGCIILEFVIWLLYDYSALTSFEAARNSEEHAYYQSKYGSNPGKDDIEVAMEVHPKVKEAVKCLAEDRRCRGTALGSLVRLVDVDLLKIVAKERLDATEVQEKLAKILEEAQDPSYLINAADPPAVLPPVFSSPPSQYTVEATNGQP